MTAFTNSLGSFIRTSRTFPQEAQPLSVEINRSYIDLANHINQRTIGVFAANKPSFTGESWFVTQGKNQTIRQAYPITGPGNVAHGINTAQIIGFTRIYGAFNGADGNFYPLPYVDVTNVNNQIALGVNPTNIVITAGAGSPPTISSGFVVLEWLVM